MREELQAKLRELKDRKEKYESHQKGLEETGETQQLTTDPEARFMQSKDGFHWYYNAQAAVDKGGHFALPHAQGHPIGGRARNDCAFSCKDAKTGGMQEIMKMATTVSTLRLFVFPMGKIPTNPGPISSPSNAENPLIQGVFGLGVVEIRGLEPLTSALRTQRSTN